MSIATEITRLQTAKANIKTSIENKGVTVPSATTIDGYPALIDQISTGVQEAEENDVNFYDYDGFRVASFTIAQAKALSALPTPPTHEGLTFQEWNWTLADIVAYNRKYANIGANYVTTDGLTHVKVSILDTNTVKFSVSAKQGTVSIDWGDSSEQSTHTYYADYAEYTFEHIYSQIGDYVIKIGYSGPSTYGLSGGNSISTRSNNIIIHECNCGNNYSFRPNGLAYITNYYVVSIPSNCEFKPSYGFRFSGLKCGVIPRERADTSGYEAISDNTALWIAPKVYDYSVPVPSYQIYVGIFPEKTNSSATIGYAFFQGRQFLKAISIPDIQFGSRPQGDFFSNCVNLCELDVVQGWTPTQSMSLNASTKWDADGMVSLFNKLGTTSSTITLTFGSTNLNKLTEDQKAIATNKGYTLA